MSAYLEADTKEAGAKRRRWSLEVKRQLVAETLEPGSSVSMVEEPARSRRSGLCRRFA